MKNGYNSEPLKIVTREESKNETFYHFQNKKSTKEKQKNKKLNFSILSRSKQVKNLGTTIFSLFNRRREYIFRRRFKKLYRKC